MIQLVDATLIVNNEVVGYMPNTLMYTEGLGEQDVRSVSIGEGNTEQLYSRDLESQVARSKFELPVTPENVRLARQWKTNQNQNVIQIVGRTAEGTLERTIAAAAFTNDYEVGIGTETSIEVEFKGNKAV